ncbi:hypothetical protein [Prosthecodimorpha staleyi]|uniref:Uncharacterized protein n=1 Tax=Prosthecodimorpha staleyi TaxID=2840188 RepID=A0A947GJI5_9HYPH|nr:hypothetical protein [Prosthecodimorpha staleyi]MBT9291724.1 hypothetical protein [Prosthecodimorpha staleyi]
MILGLSLSTFTTLHVVLSLVGIGAGLVVLADLVAGRFRPGWTLLFLASTDATSVTGFMFPYETFLPSHWVGVVSLLALTGAIVALYIKSLSGPWRAIYVVTAVLALYLNVFVGVVQAFQKIGPLRALAPTQSEPPFAIAQGLVLVLFSVLGVLALRRFRPSQFR